MTPGEFKAWFDGFTEAFTGCPTKAQWTRIKARVAEIDGKPITQTVYVDRYLREYPYWQYPGHGVYSTCANGIASGGMALASNSGQQYANALNFNSSQAMADLGRADAKALAA